MRMSICLIQHQILACDVALDAVVDEAFDDVVRHPLFRGGRREGSAQIVERELCTAENADLLCEMRADGERLGVCAFVQFLIREDSLSRLRLVPRAVA